MRKQRKEFFFFLIGEQLNIFNKQNESILSFFFVLKGSFYFILFCESRYLRKHAISKRNGAIVVENPGRVGRRFGGEG